MRFVNRVNPQFTQTIEQEDIVRVLEGKISYFVTLTDGITRQLYKGLWVKEE